jgi:hypothetical protein
MFLLCSVYFALSRKITIFAVEKKELKQENDDYAFPHHSILHPQALRKRGRLLERQAAVLRIQRSFNAAHWTLDL